MKPWHEQDAFWEEMAPHIFAADRWQQAAQDMDQVLLLAPMPHGARVLDVGCGPGRHSRELARRGFQVTGVDRTKSYVQRAVETARHEGLGSARFVTADMRTFREPDSFDIALNLYTSFGYFEDRAQDRDVMRNIHDSLHRGGKLVMDVLGKEVLAARFRPRDWTEEDGALILEERVLSDDWSWVDSRWIRIDGSGTKEFVLSQRLYSAAELKALATEAGFGRVRAFGSFEGIPYDHRASRLVILAEK